jgi:Spy/CpxP family protein refolding chaperone
MQETLEVMKSLETALDPILTPEQRRRLSRRRFGPRAFGRPPGGRPERRGSEGLERLAERLDLTPDQKSQLGVIARQQSRPTSFDVGRDFWDIESMLGRWINRQKQQDRAINDILTEDQKQEYERIKQERRQKIRDLLER